MNAHGPSPYAAPRPSRPQPEAMRALQERYSTLCQGPKSGTAGQWSRAEALELGKLYVKAWGVLPSPGRLRATYCQVQGSAILKLFGSYAAYYDAITAQEAT